MSIEDAREMAKLHGREVHGDRDQADVRRLPRQLAPSFEGRAEDATRRTSSRASAARC
jgi:hypothetical protein